MNNNSNDSHLSKHSFNRSRVVEIVPELNGQAKNRNLGSRSNKKCNRDIDYRNSIKIQMERDSSRNSNWSRVIRINTKKNQRDQGKYRNRGRHGEYNRDRNRSFLRKRDSSRDEDKRIRDKQSLVQPIQETSSFPAYNYATDFLNCFLDNNRHTLSMMPAYTNDTISMSTPWNINSIDGTTMSQSNMIINQSSSAMTISSSPEIEQTSNSRVNSKRNNSMDDITFNQSNMAMNQSSAVHESSNLEMAQTSNSRVNPKRTRWYNPMEDINTNQNNVTINQHSPAVRENTQENNFSWPVKEIIKLTKSVLYPPNRIAPRPTTREKPQGCKTVFVGNLPVKTTEEIIKEIFEKCGAIEKVSLSPSKYFCHIRFFDEVSVENALKLSEYRLEIENKYKTSYSSRIHVDYAQSKDYERKQRNLRCKAQPLNAEIDIKSQNNITVNQSSSAVPMSSGLEMSEASNTSGNVCASMAGIENCHSQFRVIAPQAINFASPVKDIIQLTKSVLYPPYSNALRPITTSKPLGCKTVIVGGLPDKASKEIINEIFETCGTIKNIRRSRKYCHIQFCDELSVENAVYFSGYRLKIENKNETRFNGRLTVRYSQAQHDYVCKRQHFQCQSTHQETNRLHVPPELLYTQNNSLHISKKLKAIETFSEAACVLISWLERGECKEKEAGEFYTMIQNTQSQVQKLHDNKIKYEEQLKEAKNLFKNQMEANTQQFTEIKKIYNAASMEKCWNNFTKNQRESIEMWKKQIEEIKITHREEVINEQEDGVIDLSNDENDVLVSQSKKYIQKVQEENNSLKCQLEAAQKEIKVEQKETNSLKCQLEAAQKEIKIELEETNSLKCQLEAAQKEIKAEQEETNSLKCQIEAAQKETNSLKCLMMDIYKNEEYIQKVQEETNSLKCQLEAAQREIKAEQEKTNSLKCQLEEAQKEIKAEQEEINSLKCRLVAARKEIKTEQPTARFMVRIKAEQEETDSLKCQLETAQNKIMVLNSDHEEEFKQKDTAPKINDVGQVRSPSEEYIHKLQEEANSLKCQLEAALKEIKAEQKEINSLKCQLEAAQKEIKAEQEETNSLKCQLETAQNKIMVLNSDHEEEFRQKDTAPKINDVGQVRSPSEEYIQKLQEEANFLKCQLEAAQKEIKAEQKETNSLKCQLEAAQKEIKAEQKETNSLKCQLEAAQKEIKAEQEETNSLKCQLEAAQKEIKAEREDSKRKDQLYLSAIQTAQQNSMNEALDLNLKYSKAETELKELRAFKCRIESGQNKNNSSHDGDYTGVSSSINSENDVRLVSLISTFLIIQPFGTSITCIWSYLHKIDSSIYVKDIEILMRRFPTLFKECSGTESVIKSMWKFTGFQTFITLS